jgi:biopolymer transport protein ExbD
MSEARARSREIPGLEEDAEPEFQVAPMVDVLLVLLLFFMATATTEVLVQTAELDLPAASDAKEREDTPGQLVINIEKLNYRLKVNDQYYDKAEEVTPIIQQASEAFGQLPGNDITQFRILVRADSKTSFSRIAEVMKASAAANVVNVTFAVAEQKEGGAAPAPQP